MQTKLNATPARSKTAPQGFFAACALFSAVASNLGANSLLTPQKGHAYVNNTKKSFKKLVSLH